jgi:hypothetical protein
LTGALLPRGAAGAAAVLGVAERVQLVQLGRLLGHWHAAGAGRPAARGRDRRHGGPRLQPHNLTSVAPRLRRACLTTRGLPASRRAAAAAGSFVAFIRARIRGNMSNRFKLSKK